MIENQCFKAVRVSIRNQYEGQGAWGAGGVCRQPCPSLPKQGFKPLSWIALCGLGSIIVVSLRLAFRVSKKSLELQGGAEDEVDARLVLAGSVRPVLLIGDVLDAGGE